MARLQKSKHPPVSWAELPHKFQLVLLILARLSEPLTMSSIRSYMYYQLKWFDPQLSDAAVSSRAGYITSAFMFAQFLTAFWWGRAADSEYLGRKRVLLIGLMGTGISSLGFGLSRTFTQAMCFRIIGGMLNGNVGVMRTMVSEMIKEKKYQARAFMLLPMTGNIGQIIGPMIGGFLADPVGSYPGVFGPNTYFGGQDGVQWMINYPYLLPNLFSAVFILSSAFVVIFGLEETHYLLKDQPDRGLELGKWLKRKLFRIENHSQYSAIPTDDSPYNPFSPDVELHVTPIHSPTRITSKPPKIKRRPQKLPFRRIFTRNVVLTLLSRGVLAWHIGLFGNLWYIFLSTPRANNHSQNLHGFQFTGGMGLPPARIGIVLSIIGGIGIFFQLLAYPKLTQQYGTTLCYRLSLLLFPIAYFLAPLLVLLPSSTPIPKPASGVAIWAGILGVLFIHVFARTFAMPSATILVNNCCPHPSVLSTIHGLSQSATSGMRMLGPLFGGWGFALALNLKFVAFPFWAAAAFSTLACMLSLAVYEGDGHEIRLEGDDDDEEEEEEEEKFLAQRMDIEIAESSVGRREHTSSSGVKTP